MDLTIHPYSAILAVISGVIFGFLINKSHLSRFDVVIGQLLLKNFSLLKVFFTAIAVSATGIVVHSNMFSTSSLVLSSTPVFIAIIGGALFGIGLALFGYLPGFEIAAAAEGVKEVFYGIAGYFVGSWIFNYLYPCFKNLLEIKDRLYQHTFSSYFDISFVVSILCIWILWLMMFFFLKRKNFN